MSPMVAQEVTETSENQKLYLLSQDKEKETARLAIFHNLTKELFASEILDSDALEAIAAKAKAENRPLRIADLGTGTACWPLEVVQILAAKNIDAQVHGYDITDEKYPSNRPKNVSLRIWDINEPPTEDMIGQYDYVQVRLFVAVLAAVKIPLALGHIKSLLRSKGYLEWTDISLARGQVSTQNLQKALEYTVLVLDAMGKDNDLVNNFDSYMEKAGFNIVKSSFQYMHKSNMEERQAMTSFLLPACLDVLRNAMTLEELREKDPLKNREEVGKIIIAAEEDLRNRPRMTMPVRRILVQKE
ncbi:hypothetical protein TWF694_009601 [Orbilia ellipsospora]|uniref:Methyltransferase domain-containing protein n=1 Tax=Orbilia ellipsospora TaxID=2528407 RepID=A0AAV9XBB7_9PEZI